MFSVVTITAWWTPAGAGSTATRPGAMVQSGGTWGDGMFADAAVAGSSTARTDSRTTTARRMTHDPSGSPRLGRRTWPAAPGAYDPSGASLSHGGLGGIIRTDDAGRAERRRHPAV